MEPADPTRRQPRLGAPVVFPVVGPLVPADVPRLCAEATTLLTDVEPGTVVECDVRALGTPDAVALEALARLQLTAKRLGHRVHLRGPSPQLRAILRRAGLCDVVPTASQAASRPPSHPTDEPWPDATTGGSQADR